MRRERVETAAKESINPVSKCLEVYCLIFSIRSLSSTGASKLKLCKVNAVCHLYCLQCGKLVTLIFSKAGKVSFLIGLSIL